MLNIPILSLHHTHTHAHTRTHITNNNTDSIKTGAVNWGHKYSFFYFAPYYTL